MIAPGPDLGGIKGSAVVLCCVKEPEGHIDTLDLIDVILIKEYLWQELLGFYVTFISLDGIFLCLFKRNDVVGGELSCELLFYNDVVTAERTFHGAK